jgi:NADH:ubiquinone oxidoreductase subunit C
MEITVYQAALEHLKPFTRWSKQNQSDLFTVSVSRQDLLASIQCLLEDGWYLSAITGLHLRGGSTTASNEKQWLRTATEMDIHSSPLMEQDSFLVLYQFCQGSSVISLRIHPPNLENAEIPSICGLIPSATLYERELIEMFGIRVTNTPDTSRFLLPEDWPDGVYPLRKD